MAGHEHAHDDHENAHDDHGLDHDGHGHHAGPDAEVDWDAQGERYAQARHHVTDTAAYEALVRDAVAGAPAGPVLDVGAGTGIWSSLLARWTRRPVGRPRARGRHAAARGGGGLGHDVHHVTAAVPRLPLAPASGAAAWLSAVLHHVGDLDDCARELRRVLRPGSPVLIRGAFAGRCDGMPQVQYFPEIAPPVRPPVPHGRGHRGGVRAPRASAAPRSPGRRAHDRPAGVAPPPARAAARPTPRSSALTDDEFAAGLARIDADIAADDVERHSVLDLLVLA